MHRIVFTFVFGMAFYSSGVAQIPLKTYEVDPITITATRLDQRFAATRNVSVITQEDIERLPAQSVAQLMNYALGVSMNSRGIAGVQSDPSLRGAGFEQILIMLDGIRMNDPQTGHHNINLPVSIQDIERIEVLRGQGSALYGPDAFGGVINVITKNPSGKRVNVDIRGGSFNSLISAGSVSLPSSFGTHTISFESSQSDGSDYKDPFTNEERNDNRQYRITTVHWKSDYRKDNHRFSLSSGYVEKDFGAQYFYTSIGSEYEETRSFYASLKNVSSFTPSFTSTVTLHFKQHKDYFNLFIDNPSIYTANHTTKRITGEWSGRYNNDDFGSLTGGIELIHEKIASNRLGDFDNNRFSVFGEYGKLIGNKLMAVAGVRLDNHSEWGTEVNPSVSFGLVVSPDLFLKASAGRSFRAPTFIELYSPEASGNRGDSGLTPEKAISFDIGVEYSLNNSIKGATTYYRRDQDQTIDWTDAGDFFQAVNFYDIVSQGIEQELLITPVDNLGISVSYTYLHQNIDKDEIDSRYLFIYPQHHFSLSPSLRINRNFDITPVLSWQERTKFNTYWILDIRANIRYGNLKFVFDALNLFNEEYQEIRNVPMPGRAVYVGVGFSY
ncbi:TonB-dependent receptor [candidate division KSB1 bacterium]|nr:TonB-dependent receptor [candidate division KSB1 bacterium]